MRAAAITPRCCQQITLQVNVVYWYRGYTLRFFGSQSWKGPLRPQNRAMQATSEKLCSRKQ